jgi:dipeptidyl-peptidase 4
MRNDLVAGLLCALVVGLACNPEPAMPPNAPSSPAAPASPTSSGAATTRATEALEPSPAARTKILGPEASAIDFERMARFPEPGWQIPRAIGYSPDGKLITYLQSESQGEQMALFAVDLATRTSKLLVRASDLHKDERPLSREEELRRERQRTRIQGVTDYAWAKDAPVMLIPHGGDLFLRGDGGEITRLTNGKEPALDPKLTARGDKVAFVRGSELVVLDVASKKETALTHGAPDGVTRGQSDFLGQEELAESSGFWWSPGGDKIAYLEVDERGVAELPVMGHRAKKPDLMQQRYPLAGAKNPVVRAGIIDLATKKTAWIKPPAGDHYIGRFQWSLDGKTLFFQVLRRDQKRVDVLRADPQTGAVTELWSEEAKAWTGYKEARLLERSPRIVASATVGGHHHLELRNTMTGARLAELTHGDWDVEHIARIDEDKGLVYFIASKDSPVERHLYTVPLEGGEIRRVTPERGVHAVVLSAKGKGWVDIHSASDRLPQAAIHGADGATIGALPIPVEADLDKLGLRTPEIVTVKSAAGDTLYGALLKPRHLEPGRKYPVIVMVYGGPGVQAVHDMWSPRLLWQHLADRGFVVFQLDNRGSAGRGPAFAEPIARRLGEVELADQLTGVEHLKKLPYVDASRVGIYGHSYGGYMAALAMFKAADHFKVGVAGSPVTDWAFYDSAYTERYMGTPAENPEGYARADLGRWAKDLQGKLFIIHALMDENVHFDNTAHLIEALIEAQKKFDLLVFPGERHGYRSPAARRYAMLRVVDYFAENL